MDIGFDGVWLLQHDADIQGVNQGHVHEAGGHGFTAVVDFPSHAAEGNIRCLADGGAKMAGNGDNHNGD